MKRILTVATVVIMTALSAHSQPQAANVSISPCRLKTSHAPAVRGIKLGMTAEDLLALFPGSADEDGIKGTVSKVANYPNFGIVGFTIFPTRYSTKERFAGISHFSFVILDGRVSQYEVQYVGPPNGPTWRKVDDFIAKLADAFELPAAKDWIGNQYPGSTKDLKCDGFQLRASNVNLSGSLMVAAFDSPFKIQRERLAAFEERARQDFRP